MIEEAGRHHNAPGEEVFAVVENRTEAAVTCGNPHHRAGVEIRHHAFLEPVAVSDEIFHRQQARHRQAGFAEIAVEQVMLERIGNMRRAPSEGMAQSPDWREAPSAYR